MYFSVSSITSGDNCTDGDLRLVGGAQNDTGRVEICLNNAWGTICRNLFGTNDALVICGQLGFSNKRKEFKAIKTKNKIYCMYVFKFFVGAVPLRTARQTSAFGLTTGPIFLDRLSCTGTESRLQDCPGFLPSVHDCDHSEDVGVQCYGMRMTTSWKSLTFVILMLSMHLDINQCDTDNGGCSQECANMLPGFECSCYSGYILDEDGRTCLG